MLINIQFYRKLEHKMGKKAALHRSWDERPRIIDRNWGLPYVVTGESQVTLRT